MYQQQEQKMTMKMKIKKENIIPNSLYSEFIKLIGTKTCENNTFRVIPVSKGSFHRLGCSEEGFPIFFVECSDDRKRTDLHLELIDVQFNRLCNLYNTDESETISRSFCLVELKSFKKDFTRYFLDVFSLVLAKLPASPSTFQLCEEISKLVQLFMGASSYSVSTVQGLWAEMFVIEQSVDPDYLIKSWHVAANDKFDFNDGKDKIEVKSTGKLSRTHEFALEQLNPNDGSRLVIASVFTIKTGVGKNIFDLESSIISKLRDIESIERLKSMIIKTLGENLDTVSEIYFDYANAIDSLSFYNHMDIPSIDVKSISTGVSNVHFLSDLTNVNPLTSDSLEGQLHKSLCV